MEGLALDSLGVGVQFRLAALNEAFWDLGYEALESKKKLAAERSFSI